MFTKSFFAIVALALAVPEQAFARYRWMERDGAAVMLHPRRFGQEHPAVITELSSIANCPGNVCGTLAGGAISTLLAASPECDQQDFADKIIDAAQTQPDAVKTAMIAAAVKFRQAEKNTPPDFTTNPPTERNSVFCQKAPKNSELKGLVQAQNPANPKDIFFDPATKASVKLGAQPNTFPFGTNGSTSGNNAAAATSTADASATASATSAAGTACAPDVTVTVTVGGDAATATLASTSVSSAAGAAATNGAAASNIGDFGKCSIPQITFGAGIENRKETSFIPTDLKSYNHGSAQNIDIITRFMCDQLVNFCGADQTAKDTCATATAASKTKTAKTGDQADAFNAAFGIKTNFASVQALDDQGRAVGTPSAAAGTAAATTVAAATTTAAAATTTAATATSTGTAQSGDAGALGNFGKCTVPEITFGAGIEGRKETSFIPTDLKSYNHGSAQNGAIITQFVCDQLVNSCGADQTAKDTCQKARAAFDAATPAKSGAQADAFNAVFNIKTNFKSIAALDNQGKVVVPAA